MRLITTLITLVLLSACGQAGPLYLPDPEPAAKQERDGVAPVIPEAEERKPGRPQDP